MQAAKPLAPLTPFSDLSAAAAAALPVIWLRMECTALSYSAPCSAVMEMNSVLWLFSVSWPAVAGAPSGAGAAGLAGPAPVEKRGQQRPLCRLAAHPLQAGPSRRSTRIGCVRTHLHCSASQSHKDRRAGRRADRRARAPATSVLSRRSTKGPSTAFMRSVSLAISASSPCGTPNAAACFRANARGCLLQLAPGQPAEEQRDSWRNEG